MKRKDVVPQMEVRGRGSGVAQVSIGVVLNDFSGYRRSYNQE